VLWEAQMKNTIEALLDAAKDFIKWAPGANRAARDDVRAVVVRLGSTLDRAILLAILYLQGAGATAPAQVHTYLLEARRTLLETCNEFNVCADLYNLADRFKMLFDPAKYAVSLGQSRAIPDLLSALGDRERSVLDGISDTLHWLTEDVGQMDPHSKDFSRRLEDRINGAVANLHHQQLLIRDTVRAIVDAL